MNGKKELADEAPDAVTGGWRTDPRLEAVVCEGGCYRSFCGTLLPL